MTKPSPQQSRRTAFILLAVLSALPYLFSINHDFVYDDHGQLVENAFLENPGRMADLLTLQTLGEPGVVNGRRPLVLLTYFWDKATSGNSPIGYHLTNLFFHLAAVLLLFNMVGQLAQKTLPDRAPRLFAFTAALLFGTHPLLTEAIRLPSFRPDILFMFFTLLHLRTAWTVVEQYSWHWLVRIIGCGLTMLAALMSKETGVIAPALMAWMWVCFPTTRPPRGTMTVLLSIDALLILAVALLSMGGDPLQVAGSSWNGVSLQPPANYFTAPWLWVKSLGLILWPDPLVVDRIVTPVTSASSLRFLSGLGLGLVTALASFFLIKKSPWISFSLAWMLLVFLPVSNLVPLINPMADRYLYGIVAGASLFGAFFIIKTPAKTYRAIVGVLVTLYILSSFWRLSEWKDGATLWKQTLRDEPRSARAWTWVGLDHKKAGDIEQALTHFEKAIEANPRVADARVNAALIHGQRGDLVRAEEYLREAIRLRPEKPDAYWNLCVDLELQGKPEEITGILEQGLAVAPYHMRMRHALTERMITEGRIDEAKALVLQTLEIDPANQHAQAVKGFLEQK